MKVTLLSRRTLINTGFSYKDFVKSLQSHGWKQSGDKSKNDGQYGGQTFIKTKWNDRIKKLKKEKS